MSEVFNCGYGTGYSVKEVLNTIENIIGKKLNIKEASRRPGDPAALIADPTKIKKVLAWEPRHNDLKFIIKTALDWEMKNKA